MKINRNEIILNFDTFNSTELLILPFDFDENNSSTEYTSSALSFVKILNSKTPTKLASSPETLIELRDASWLAPALLITAKTFFENPDIVQVISECIIESLKRFTLEKSEKKIKISVYCEKKENKKIFKIDYEGDISGLDQLSKSITEVLNDK